MEDLMRMDKHADRVLHLGQVLRQGDSPLTSPRTKLAGAKRAVARAEENLKRAKADQGHMTAEEWAAHISACEEELEAAKMQLVDGVEGTVFERLVAGTGAHDQGMGWVTGRQTPPPANDCIFYIKGEDQLRLRRELLAMDVDTTGFVSFAQLAEAMRMCGLPMPDTPRVQAHSLPDERIDYLAYISEVGEQALTDRRFLDSDPEFISLSGLEPDSAVGGQSRAGRLAAAKRVLEESRPGDPSWPVLETRVAADVVIAMNRMKAAAARAARGPEPEPEPELVDPDLSTEDESDDDDDDDPYSGSLA